MADLDANLSQMVDPETLQKLLAMRDQLPQQSNASSAASSLPTEATDPSYSPSYDQLFSQNADMQSQLAPQLANKSAAESADVLASAPEGAESALAGAGDVAAEAGAGEAATGLGALGPIGALIAGMYPSTSAASDMDDVPGAKSPKEQANAQMALPWGGMSDQQLANYVKYKNTGPQATTGFNPNAVVGPNIPSDILAQRQQDDQDDDDDEDDSTPSKPSSKVSVKGVPGVSSQPTDVGGTNNKDALGALMAKLGIGNNSALAAAQARQNQLNSISRGSAIGKEFAAALSRGAYKPDYTFNNDLAQQGATAVQQAQQKQASDKEATETGLKLSDLVDKQQLSDANSSVSQAYRNMAATLNPALAQSPGFQNMTAETIKNSQPMVDAQLKAQTLQLMRQQMMQNKQQGAQDRADQKQQQNYNQTVNLLEQMRGSPAVQQAEKDIYSAQKANTLANLYGDPNNLSPQMTSLLTQEVAKIAQGGVPTHEELAALNPGALQGKLAGVYGKLMNEPTPANAGEFIKQYQQYVNGLQKDAQGVIQDRYGRIINAKKSQFTPDQVQTLQDNYINRFKPTQSYTPSAGSHPQDSDMLNWAQKNMNSSDPATRQAAMQVIQSNLVK